MTDKHLTESAWKSFAKGGDYKDAALLKALAALSKAERDGPQAVLDALDDLDKQLKTLRSAHKGNKDLAGYLDKVDKAAEAQRKDSQKELKEAETADDEEEDSPALLTSKLVPLIKQVRKGDVVMKAMIVTTGKDTAVMLSKRAIAPTRSKLLKEYLGASGGAKTILGDCMLEENAITFVVQSQAAGLAKKLKAALMAQTELRLKIRVRGEDPDDIDQEGEDGEGDQAQPEATADAPPPDELQIKFDARLAKLEPLIAAALRAQRGDVAKIRAVADFAREKGGSGNPAAGLKALDAVEQLLRAAVDSASAKPQADEKAEGDGKVDPAAAFQARLAAMLPKVKDFIATAGERGQEVKLKVGESGVFARKREFERAHALLDEAEALLLNPTSGGEPETKPEPSGDDRVRAEYERVKASLEGDFDKAKQARLTIEQAEQLTQARSTWTRAETASNEGDHALALKLMQELADTAILQQLVEQAVGDDSSEAGRIRRQRQFLISRWARIPGEIHAQLRALRQNADFLEADEDAGDLVDGIEAELKSMLDELQAEIDDAINAGDNSVFAGVRQRVLKDALMAHLQAAPDFDGKSLLRTVESALDEVENAMTA